MKNLAFMDLLDINSLQLIQDSFSEYTGLALVVVDTEGNPVTKYSGGSEFCNSFMKSSRKGACRCAECDNEGAKKAFSSGKAVFYTCHAGMTDFVIPIIFAERIVGTILAGQVRANHIDEEQCREMAGELGLDPDEYIEKIKKAPQMPEGQIEKTAHFLSEFSRALSILAYANYKKIQKSRKLENAARSQSGYIVGLTEDLRGHMKDWIDLFKDITDKYKDMPEVRAETDVILSKGQEVYSVIDGVVDYIHLSGGNVEYSENVYDIKKLMKSIRDSLQKEAEKANVTITSSFMPLLPKTFMGNSGRIGQAVSRLTGNMLKYTKSGGSIKLFTSCEKKPYACIMTIKISCVGCCLDEGTKKMITKTIHMDVSDSYMEDNSRPDDMQMSLIVFLIRQMCGTIQFEDPGNEQIVFTIEIPQLDGEKTSA